MTNLAYWQKMAFIILACSACAGPPPTTADELTPIENEAHLVFIDQVKRLHRDKDDAMLTMCTSIASGKIALPVSAMLLEVLRKAVAGVANVTFVDGATCHEDSSGVTFTSDGERAIRLFGEREEDSQTKEVTWFAGATWGSLGGGAVYDVIMKDSVPTLETTSLWNL